MLNVLLQNIELREQLEFEATHDNLTGLFNRQRILEEVERECRRADRYDIPMSVVMVDLDHFKSVNDNHGHQAGDKVLREFAATLRSTMREFDAAGRFGGEEFLVLLPHTEAAGAAVWAQRLVQQVEAMEVTFHGKAIRVTASCGVTTARSGMSCADSLIAASDAALYEAKAEGRNRIKVASHDAVQLERKTPI
jgi:diguanylate cyclase (GGDEF)-like protein